MSGTPIKATPEEIIPALRMIDPYFTEELAIIYKKSFNDSSEEISKVVKQRFERIMYRKTKSQVLRLPEKHIEKIKLSVKDPSSYLLKEVKEKINIEFEKEYAEKLKEYVLLRERFEILVKRFSSAPKNETKGYLDYIHMNTDPKKKDSKEEIHEYREEIYKKFLADNVYPNIDDPYIKKELEELVTKYIFMVESARGKAIGKILPPAKTNCYIDILDNNQKKIIEMIQNNPKKTIIFTPFLEVAKHAEIVMRKNGIGCVKIIGETKDRMDIIQKFKNDDMIDVLIATVQTLSTGVTLTEANQMFFLGTPYRDADFQQACDRIHRIGQTMDVYIYIILLESKQKNITDRIQEIMDWSADSSNSIIN